LTRSSSECGSAAADLEAVAAPLMALHVAANTEGLAASRVRALEGLLAGVGVAVDAKAARAAKGLVAGLADVAVLALREGPSMRRVHIVVVVLPWVGARGSHGDGQRRRKRLRQ
jgi:hypothetical protein